MKANKKFRSEEEAVSAVIGVILMVAITVAIAATVYLYVSGMIGGGMTTTPTISLVPDATDHNATITISSISDPTIEWADCWFTLVDLTNATEWIRGGKDWGITVTIPRTGEVTGGQLVRLNQQTASGTLPLTDNHEYQLTINYNQTGGSMGSAKWLQ